MLLVNVFDAGTLSSRRPSKGNGETSRKWSSTVATGEGTYWRDCIVEGVEPADLYMVLTFDERLSL